MYREQTRPTGRRVVLNLTFTTVLTFVFLFVAAITAAYVWGVMSGRHLALENTSKVETQASLTSSQTAPEGKTEGILKPQELDFVRALRGDSRPAQAEAKPKQEQAPKPEEAARDETREKRENTPATSTQEKPGTVQTGAYFDHVFQVAALKDEQSADSLREKLEGRGLRTRLEHTGKLYIVLVLLRGDAARAAEVYQIMNDLRLGEPLLRSKKPVGL